MNQDFVDLLQAFVEADVRFMVVGAYALAVHGRPRSTGDGEVAVAVIGLSAFIKNKRATGRLKDLADIEGLD